jgi:hypothetical protein
VVCDDGQVGMNIEHSMIDGHTIIFELLSTIGTMVRHLRFLG